MSRDQTPKWLRFTRVVAAACVLWCAGPSVAVERATKQKDGSRVESPKPQSVLLGRFMLRDLRTVEGAKTRLSFSLYGVATGDAFARLTKLLPHFEQRVRSEVGIAVRLTPLPDFEQPALERFRRRMLARLRRAFPTLPVEALLIGEFELFIE